MKLRIQFSKYGPLRFIGHLDVMRFFQKAIRRAGIDIAYSSGFSPHQIMSFASPLGLGVESRGEYLDIQVNEPMKNPMNAREMKGRLNAACVEGIEILRIVRLPDNAGNAMASVAAASYTAAMKQDESVRQAGVSLSDFSCLEPVIPDFLAQDQIFITKETKKGVSQVDIRPGIFSLSVHDGVMEFLVDASSAGNIKPYALLDALLSFAGKETDGKPELLPRSGRASASAVLRDGKATPSFSRASQTPQSTCKPENTWPRPRTPMQCTVRTRDTARAHKWPW